MSDVVFSLSESKAGNSEKQVSSVAGQRLSGQSLSGRWLLWVDGVGGFLVLPGDDWTIGGPSGAEDSEICIQGDLARREACIRRQGSDYVLQPLGTVMLGGRRMSRPTLLKDGDKMLLGTGAAESRTSANPVYSGMTGRGVRMEFSKPHPLSASARLILESRHKTRPRSDGIILMADTCILGPSRACHISTAIADNELVLLLREGRWFCRGAGETLVDGVASSGRVEVPVGAKVENGGLCFTLEAT